MNRNELFQRLSGHFLSEHLPENWHEMSEKELSDFISENPWEPLEHLNADDIFGLIDVLTTDVEAIIDGRELDLLGEKREEKSDE
jgi:hypothetical protein